MNWTLFVDKLVDEPWIENGANAVKESAGRAIDALPRQVRNFLHGVWLGHPFHPVVTDIVVGSYSTLAVLDVAEAAGMKQIAPASDLALATGLSSGMVAAAAGFTDWHVLSGKAKKVGFLHMLFNVTGTLLYAGSLIARKAGNRGLGRALAFAGYGTLFGGAYLGGHLVFAKKVGVDHAADWETTNEFKHVMAEADLMPGQLKRVEMNDVPVVLFRYSRRVIAMSDSCAHRGCPLSENGIIEGDTIRCSCHGSRYRIDSGLVVEGPSAHPQPVYDVRVRAGNIEVRQPKG
jgi:nitrite reductase/ring-hydroxylating ferredoxin subunit